MFFNRFKGRDVKKRQQAAYASSNNKKQQAYQRKKGKGKGKGEFDPSKLTFQSKETTETRSSKTDSKEEVHEEGNVEVGIAFREIGDALFGYRIETVLE